VLFETRPDSPAYRDSTPDPHLHPTKSTREALDARGDDAALRRKCAVNDHFELSMPWRQFVVCGALSCLGLLILLF